MKRRPISYNLRGKRPVWGPYVGMSASTCKLSAQLALEPALVREVRARTVLRLFEYVERTGRVILGDVIVILANSHPDDWTGNTYTLLAEATTLDLRRQLDWPSFDPFPRATRVARFLRRVYDLPRDAGYRAAIRFTTWRTRP